MSDLAVPGQRRTVVLVDDTADLRDLLRVALERHEFDVVAEAGNGLEGIEAVAAHRPDVILLDLAMPVMDGLEALPRMRELCPDARILVLSGFGATTMARKAVAAGADGYLQKGAPLTRVLAHVRGDDPPPARSTLAEALPERPRPHLSLARPPEEATAPDEGAPRLLDLLPWPVLEVRRDPARTVVRRNRAAAELLGEACVGGSPLAASGDGLAALLAGPDPADGVRLDAGTVEGLPEGSTLLVRHRGDLLLLVLDAGRDASASLRRAIATAAHEIRNPVAVLAGIAETLSDATPGLDPVHEGRLLGTIARQVRLLDRVTADLLTAAQAERGTLDVVLEPVDPVDVVEAARGHLASVTLQVTDRRQVLADPDRLQQMVGNLLSNAEKYARPPFVVRIRPHATYAALSCIDVVDPGPGVPEDVRATLFEEFTRGGGHDAPGTGLGLYVVRSLARAQGGEVEHHPEDGGSCFTITLPAVGTSPG